MSDPRVFFAAERTLLAWLRSGLTVMALGFVVARFGLFLGMLSVSGEHAGPMHGRTHFPSAALGITLVLVGVFIILGAAYNHRTYVRSLPPEDIPPIALPWLSSFLSFALAAAGILVAIYLAVA